MGLLANLKSLLFGRKISLEYIDPESFPFDILSKKEAKEFFYKQGNVLACKEDNISARIQDTPESGHKYLFELFQYSWCKHWIKISDKKLSLTVSDNFILLSFDEQRRIDLLLKFAEKAFDIINEHLHIKKQMPGKLLIFHLNREDYYDLEDSLTKAESSEEVLSGGMFVRNVIPYMVFHSEKDQNLPDIVLAHELTHALLSLNNLPMWLDEALACTMEKTITGECYYDWTLETGLKNLSYWDSLNIQHFWVGESFFVNKSQEYSYLLAQGIFNTILRHHKETFRDFINSAKRFDGGESAAIKYLGESLGDIANKYMGEGPWQPSQSYIKSYFGNNMY
ncbi:MAG: hypothetical protein NE328_03895 [Lentisphaeraceae bacterium]|nr:hypothetical protein [Lentisphaeraceae bacterium]